MELNTAKHHENTGELCLSMTAGRFAKRCAISGGVWCRFMDAISSLPSPNLLPKDKINVPTAGTIRLDQFRPMRLDQFRPIKLAVDIQKCS